MIKKTLFGSVLLSILIFTLTGCMDIASNKSYTSEDIGLRKTNLLDESGVTLSGFEYISTPAGESTNIERSFENAPPLISHDVEGMMEITTDLNMCISCHLPELAEPLNATAMPRSHFLGMMTSQDLGGKVVGYKDLGDVMDEARYNCNQCHVPQAVGLKPLVDNKFNANFRNDNSEHQSNLIDIMNEGVQ